MICIPDTESRLHIFRRNAPRHRSTVLLFHCHSPLISPSHFEGCPLTGDVRDYSLLVSKSEWHVRADVSNCIAKVFYAFQRFYLCVRIALGIRVAQTLAVGLT